MSRNRRSGNPNWGKPHQVNALPPQPTGFELEMKRLGLTLEDCFESSELREWCRRHRNDSFVHESLLKRWNIVIDVHEF
jgi:hypothetical protein